MEIFRDVFPDSHPQLKYLVWFLLDFIFNDYFIGNSHTRNIFALLSDFRASPGVSFTEIIES